MHDVHNFKDNVLLQIYFVLFGKILQGMLKVQ